MYKLTSKQEGYAQDRASGLDRSAAYRNNYGTSNMSDNTVWEEASRLDKHPKVTLRIAELQAATEAALAEKRLWDIERLVDEAETNLDLARIHKQMGSANGALELIGKATGLLSDKPRDPQVQITRVTVVLDRGPDAEGESRLVEETTYRELPPVAEGEYRDIPVEDDEDLGA